VSMIENRVYYSSRLMNTPHQPQEHLESEKNHADKSMKENTLRGNFFVDVIKFALLALLIVVPFRLFVAQPFIVSGASMAPTFTTGEYLIIDQLSYRFDKPERGDVVIFRYPENPSIFFIKRIIGLPGETIEISPGDISVRSDDMSSALHLAEPYLALENVDRGISQINLDDTEYFVMGDNRKASSDSRTWGPLPEDLIIGRALLRLLPLQKIELLPGKFTFQQE
jgi:signal peptidase I